MANINEIFDLERNDVAGALSLYQRLRKAKDLEPWMTEMIMKLMDADHHDELMSKMDMFDLES